MTLTLKGIACYGVWREDSNALLIGDWADGSEIDDVWCPDVAYKTWADVVDHLSRWADSNGHTLYEVTAC